MKPADFDTHSKWIKACIREMEGATDVEYIIIKGHIITELMLDYFIERINSKVEVKDIFRLYSQKLKIFEMIIDNQDLMDKLSKLNSIRNKLAHTMKVNANSLGVFHSIATLNNHQKSLLPKVILNESMPKYRTISSMINILNLMYLAIDLHFDIERIKTSAWLKQRSRTIKKIRNKIVAKPQTIDFKNLIPLPQFP